MLIRIVLGVVVGGGIGLVVGYFGKSMGGQCPIACNPYVSTGVGVVIGLALASRAGAAGPLPQSPNVLRLASEEQYRQLVSESDKLVLVEFYTRRCPNCVKQMPVIDALADRYAGRVQVAVVNARQVSGIAAEENINAVPTTLVVKGGRVVEKLAGLKSEQELAGVLDRHLAGGDAPDAGQSDRMQEGNSKP